MNNKVITSLLTTIDNSNLNDITINLQDGNITASKIVLSSTSDYFKAMFKLESKFKENEDNSVTFNCSKVIMLVIVKYLYGKELTLTGLSSRQIIDLLEMLRLLLLEEAITEIHKLFRKQSFACVASFDYMYQLFGLITTVVWRARSGLGGPGWVFDYAPHHRHPKP